MTLSGQFYEIAGAFIIAAAALMGKMVENARAFMSANSLKNQNAVAFYYECLNVHLHLSLGVLGLAWSQQWNSLLLFPLFGLILAGAMSKGFFVISVPDSLRFRNPGAFLGLWLPNSLALVCLMWIIAAKFCTADKDSTLSSGYIQGSNPAQTSTPSDKPNGGDNSTTIAPTNAGNSARQ